MHNLSKAFRICSFLIVFCFVGLISAYAQTAPIGPYGTLVFSQTNTAADTATLVAGQMGQSLLTGTPTGAASYTTPTATILCRLFPFVGAQQSNNFAWDFWIKNTAGSAVAITLAAGSGVTIVGTATAAQNFVRHFKVVLTNCTAGTTAAARIYSLETTAF